MPAARKLNVFISYALQDETRVRELYKRLSADAWISPWFDKEMLLPGMDWDLEITKALRAADVIIICLSTKSVSKEGYVQREIKRALDYSDEKPEGTIYVIPLRLDNCEAPLRMQKWQWVDDFAAEAHEKLLKSLKLRAEGLGIAVKAPKSPVPSSAPAPADEDIDLYKFIKITSLAVPEPFWIGKYPVTNAQYERFLKAEDFATPAFWTGFPKYDENCKLIGDWGEAGLNWLKDKLKEYEYFPPELWNIEPRFWPDKYFGVAQRNNTVVGVTWYEANAYCKWLSFHWRELSEESTLSSFILPSSSFVFRLPLEIEWVAAAGGNKPEGRYSWDLPGKATTDEQEIIKRTNVVESKISHTTPVNQYPAGKSPFGVMDMSGNIWEWQANYYDKDHDWPALRGGSWGSQRGYARVSGRIRGNLYDGNSYLGFRVAVVLPPSR